MDASRQLEFMSADFAIAQFALKALNDKELVQKALNGDEEAGMKIAQMYYEGDGVIQDYTEAIKWYKIWAEKGNPYAQYYMGLCHDEGHGLEASLTKAMEFYKH